MEQKLINEFEAAFEKVDNVADLDKIVYQMYAARRKMITNKSMSRARGVFRVGEKVAFIRKSGERIEGTIRSLNAKSVTVMTGATSGFRVPPSQLLKVE